MTSAQPRSSRRSRSEPALSVNSGGSAPEHPRSIATRSRSEAHTGSSHGQSSVTGSFRSTMAIPRGVHGQLNAGSMAAMTIALRYLMRCLRDVISFLIRGGVSALLFFIDQLVNIVVVCVEALAPGPVASIMTTGTRMVTWCFGTAMWIIYTALELLFYLPPPLLLIYVIMLLGMYLQSHEAIDSVLYLMVWSASYFLHLLKAFVWQDYHPLDQQINPRF